MHCVPQWWSTTPIDRWAVFFAIEEEGGMVSDTFLHTGARMMITRWCQENCSGQYRIDDDCVRFDLEADAVLAMVAW
jgi:hypothetical protein